MLYNIMLYKEWGYKDLYLLVNSENAKAQKLYQKSGMSYIYILCIIVYFYMHINVFVYVYHFVIYW